MEKRTNLFVEAPAKVFGAADCVGQTGHFGGSPNEFRDEALASKARVRGFVPHERQGHTSGCPVVLKFRRGGTEVEIIGLNEASTTSVDRLVIHDKPGVRPHA